MKQLSVALGLLLLVGFGATGAAVAQTAASIEGNGACNYEENQAEDTSGASVGADGPAISEPDEATIQDALDNCIAAASNGELPGGGSKLELSVAVADGAGTADLSTVPLSDLATQQEDAVSNGATAEGACNYEDSEASDSSSAALGTDDQSVSEPDQEELQAGLENCAAAASNGELPDGGSYLRGDAALVNGAIGLGFDTVPLSQAAP